MLPYFYTQILYKYSLVFIRLAKRGRAWPEFYIIYPRRIFVKCFIDKDLLYTFP